MGNPVEFLEKLTYQQEKKEVCIIIFNFLLLALLFMQFGANKTRASCRICGIKAFLNSFQSHCVVLIWFGHIKQHSTPKPSIKNPHKLSWNLAVMTSFKTDTNWYCEQNNKQSIQDKYPITNGRSVLKSSLCVCLNPQKKNLQSNFKS